MLSQSILYCHNSKLKTGCLFEEQFYSFLLQFWRLGSPGQREGFLAASPQDRKQKGKRAHASEGRGRQIHLSYDPILLVTNLLQDNGINPLKRAVLSWPDHFLKVLSLNTATLKITFPIWTSEDTLEA